MKEFAHGHRAAVLCCLTAEHMLSCSPRAGGKLSLKGLAQGQELLLWGPMSVLQIPVLGVSNTSQLHLQ